MTSPETQPLILVSVGLCEQRNFPITRMGVTETEPTLEIQDLTTLRLTDLKSALDTILPELVA